MSKSEYIRKTEAKRLLKRLEMKYKAELVAITAQMASEQKAYGYVSLETEAQNEALIERIKREQDKYQ